MARLTWQQVAAPDFDSAVRAQQSAAGQLSGAIGGFGKLFGGLESDQQNRANAHALDQMMKIQDHELWNKTVQEHGLGGALGVDTAMLGDDMRKLAYGRRDELFGDYTSDYTQGRVETLDTRADNEYADGLKRAERQSQAKLIAQDYLQNAGKFYKPEVARKHVLSQNYDPEMQGWILDAMGSQPQDVWEVDGRSRDAIERSDLATNIRDSLAVQKDELALKMGSNAALRYYSQGADMAGASGDAGKGLVDALRGRIDAAGGGNLSETELTYVNETPGKINDFFREMKKQYGSIPDGVIAAVIRENLEGGSWKFINDDYLGIARNDVKGILDTLNTTEGRTNLQKVRAEYDRTMRTTKSYQDEYDDLVTKLARDSANPNSASFKKHEAQLRRLGELMAGKAQVEDVFGPGAGTSPSPSGSGAAAPSAAAAAPGAAPVIPGAATRDAPATPPAILAPTPEVLQAREMQSDYDQYGAAQAAAAELMRAANAQQGGIAESERARTARDDERMRAAAAEEQAARQLDIEAGQAARAEEAARQREAYEAQRAEARARGQASAVEAPPAETPAAIARSLTEEASTTEQPEETAETPSEDQLPPELRRVDSSSGLFPAQITQLNDIIRRMVSGEPVNAGELRLWQQYKERLADRQRR